MVSALAAWMVGVLNTSQDTSLERTSMLNKTQLIDGIVELNQSARRDWLDSFESSSLKHYLDHLRWQLGPRSGKNVWQRPNETPAMLTRTPID